MTINADPGKYKYSAYGIRFDVSGSFSLSDGIGFSKNLILFGADISSFAGGHNRKKRYPNSW